MVITYKINAKIEAHQLADLFSKSGLSRPIDDLNRIKKMIENANLLITAWDGDKLVGVARALSDYSFCTYISDLAIDKEYQNQGIGHDLVNKVLEQAGEVSNFILLSPPETMEYYPKIGFEKSSNAFIITRKK